MNGGTVFITLLCAYGVTAVGLFLLEKQVRVRALRIMVSRLEQGAFLIDAHGVVECMNSHALMYARPHKTLHGQQTMWACRADGTPVAGMDIPWLAALAMKRNQASVKIWLKDAEKRVYPVKVSVTYITGMSPRALVLLNPLTEEDPVDALKADFISMASHQLRTPLTSIKWYGDLLRKQQQTKQGADYVARINEAVQDMVALVDDFLDVSRLEMQVAKNHIEPVRMRELLEHILSIQQPFIEQKRLRVSLSDTTSRQVVYADPAFLREVLANFVSNGVKYNRTNGSLTVALRARNGMLYVRVSDTGIGIAATDKKQIFTRFFRGSDAVKQGYKGTGLGLYTAKMLLDHMGGSVRFRSVLGKGTTFWITIPIGNKQYSSSA